MINSELETFIFMENINIAPGSLLKSVLVGSWVGMLVRSQLGGLVRSGRQSNQMSQRSQVFKIAKVG